jgi:hypothetical protein
MAGEDQLSENDASGKPPEGAVRYGGKGNLEIFNGTSWEPLIRVSDVDQPPILRHITLVAQPISTESVEGPPASEETANPKGADPT